jgi:adenylate cyclase
MGEQLSMDVLAERTGDTTDRLAAWADRSLIGDSTGRFDANDIERIWLIRALLAREVELDDVARVMRDHSDVLERFASRWLVEGKRIYTLDYAADQAGLSQERVQRLWRAAGLAQGTVATDEDVDALRNLRLALDAGLPEDALVQILRVFGEALGRVAEAETRLFHVYVHKRLQEQGLAGVELLDENEAVSRPLEELVEPAILYFHRKARDRALRDDLVTHLAEAAGLWPTIDATGRMPAAVAFIDLSGFTSLTAAMGDLAAVGVIDRFSAIVRDTVQHSLGQVIKQIGDGFMLLFPDAPSALRCALALEEWVTAEPQFPAARVGVHWGPVLYRDGDYVGATVNVAARVTAEAHPHQVLVTGAVRDQASRVDDIEFALLGRRRLRGIPETVELFQVRPTTARPDSKLVDPVCRMELTPAEISARVTIETSEHIFCSTECLQLFVAAPGRYAPSR